MEPIKVGKTYGYTKCPEWLKRAFYKAVDGYCQQCRQKKHKLEPHRIKRGNIGGLYTVCPLNHKDNNIKVCCKECHQNFHKNELNHVSHRY